MRMMMNRVDDPYFSAPNSRHIRKSVCPVFGGFNRLTIIPRVKLNPTFVFSDAPVRRRRLAAAQKRLAAYALRFPFHSNLLLIIPPVLDRIKGGRAALHQDVRPQQPDRNRRTYDDGIDSNAFHRCARHGSFALRCRIAPHHYVNGRPIFCQGAGLTPITARTSPCCTVYKASGSSPRWSCRPRTRA